MGTNEILEMVTLICERDFLDNLNLILQIGTNIFVIVSVIIAFKQFAIYRDETKENQNKSEAEKAISIAEEFAKFYISEMSYILRELKAIGMREIVNKKDSKNMRNFDNEEIIEIFTEEEIRIMENLKNNMSIELKSKMSEILNRLEYVAMYLNSGIANEEIIYPSLHQVFLPFIKSCYYIIAELNSESSNKYYTNVIKLYNLWNDKYINDVAHEKELETQENVVTQQKLNEIKNAKRQMVKETPNIKIKK